MLSLKFRYAVLGAVNAQEVMRVNVCFGILVHFFLTVFENDSYSRHVENSFGYVYAPQTSTIKRLPWKISLTER